MPLSLRICLYAIEMSFDLLKLTNLDAIVSDERCRNRSVKLAMRSKLFWALLLLISFAK